MDTMLSTPHPAIAAVIAAAGRSTRMGEPKQLLPWGDRTVLAAVAAMLGVTGLARARLGGVTGDVYGAVIELAELAILLVYAVHAG